MLMAGSSIFLGDKLPFLNEKGLDLMLKKDEIYSDLFTEKEYAPKNGVLLLRLDAHDSACLQIK